MQFLICLPKFENQWYCVKENQCYCLKEIGFYLRRSIVTGVRKLDSIPGLSLVLKQLSNFKIITIFVFIFNQQHSPWYIVDIYKYWLRE